MSDEGVDGQQLGEGMAAKFECPVNVPSFSFAEVVKLLLGCENQVAAVPDMNVSAKEIIRYVVLLQVALKAGGLFRS